MKFWLIIFFFNTHGDFIDKKESVYANKAQCYSAMSKIKPPRDARSVEMLCVSDDHHSGRKQDPGVNYD